MLKFEEQSLKHELDQMPPRLRTAFAASCGFSGWWESTVPSSRRGDRLIGQIYVMMRSTMFGPTFWLLRKRQQLVDC